MVMPLLREKVRSNKDMVKRSLLQSLNYEGFSTALTTKTTHDTPSQRSTLLNLMLCKKI